MSLHQDAHGTLWIGTMGSGLRKLTPDGRVESIPVRAGDPRSLSAAGIMTIYESRSGRIWSASPRPATTCSTRERILDVAGSAIAEDYAVFVASH